MTASFISPTQEPAERFKTVMNFYNELSGKTGQLVLTIVFSCPNSTTQIVIYRWRII